MEKLNEDKLKQERIMKVRSKVDWKNEKNLEAITKKIERDDTRVEVHEAILKEQ